MKNIIYAILLIIFLSFTISSCGKKDNCANCKAYIALNEVVLVIWTIDSFKLHVPKAKESDWCTLLEKFNGEEYNLNGFVGTLGKSCE